MIQIVICPTKLDDLDRDPSNLWKLDYLDRDLPDLWKLGVIYLNRDLYYPFPIVY